MKIKIQGYIELDKEQARAFLADTPQYCSVKVEKVVLPVKSVKELRA